MFNDILYKFTRYGILKLYEKFLHFFSFAGALKMKASGKYWGCHALYTRAGVSFNAVKMCS